METRPKRNLRIVAALEQLIDEEAAALANADWTGVFALQNRIGPVIDFLVAELGGACQPPELRDRLRALHARRSQTSRALGRQIECTRDELDATRSARMRVAQIAPTYGFGAATPHRLQLVG